ncbi:MAG: hypothetical protein Q7S27_04795 [Nanoarchaeota archaeon]|nr:hypothetical protein [Nanoarchaeota archaeon]
MNLDQIFIYAIVLAVVIFIISYIIKMLKGKIAIELEKFEYSTGEEIKGQVILKLRKEVKATALNIGIIGERKQKSSFGRKSSSQKNAVYEFKKPISGEKIYPAGESKFDFKLKTPSNIESKINSGNATVDTMMNTMLSYAGMIRWYVVAELEVAGLNIKKKVQINIS